MLPGVWSDRLLDILLSPRGWLSLLLAVLYSTLFTLWRGGGWRQWPRDLVLGAVGFMAGQLGSSLSGLAWLRIGEVEMVWGAAGAVIALLLGQRFRRSSEKVLD
jgi:hypothetical protein